MATQQTSITVQITSSSTIVEALQLSASQTVGEAGTSKTVYGLGASATQAITVPTGSMCYIHARSITGTVEVQISAGPTNVARLLQGDIFAFRNSDEITGVTVVTAAASAATILVLIIPGAS